MVDLDLVEMQAPVGLLGIPNGAEEQFPLE
jgi:hypothetical protein